MSNEVSGSAELKTGTSLPTVSVITITYNDLDGLKRTVESVRAQRYPGRIEHIVIDGGSGDEVIEYLSGIEPAFTYWQSEPDGGRYDAMNQGIAHASGDLLWFLHSSDLFPDPDTVAAAVDAVAGQDSLDFFQILTPASPAAASIAFSRKTCNSTFTTKTSLRTVLRSTIQECLLSATAISDTVRRSVGNVQRIASNSQNS